MAKVTIDELVIALGFDTSALSKGQREALASFKRTQESAHQSANKMEKDGERAAQFFSKIKGEALALGAVLIGANGLKDFVGKTVTGLVQLGIAANNIGIATKEVSAFQSVMERNGGTSQGALAILQKIAQINAQAKLGAMPDPQYFRGLQAIGGQLGDDPIKVYEKFIQWTEGQKDKTRVSAIGAMLGFDDASIALAAKGLKNFRAEMALGRANAPTDDAIKQAQEINRAWKELGQTITKIVQGPLLELLNKTVGALNTLDAIVHPEAHGWKRTANGIPYAPGSYADRHGGRSGVEVGLDHLFGRDKGKDYFGRDWASVQSEIAAIGNGTWSPGGAVGLPGSKNGQVSEAVKWGRAGLAFSSDSKVRAGQIKAYYMARGWSATAAEGIVLGMGAETAGTYSERIKNPTSTAWGIGQWTQSSGRWKEFERLFHHDIHSSTLEEQLAFLNYELTVSMRDGGNAIARSKSKTEAARNYVNSIMRPGLAGSARDMAYVNAHAGTTIQIENINISVPSGDPKAIARDLHKEIKVAAQVNGGPR